jgi:hypothetical protein
MWLDSCDINRNEGGKVCVCHCLERRRGLHVAVTLEGMTVSLYR